MIRKLVKQGPATMTVSIPKDWIDRFHLRNGDEVNIEEKETKLIISSSKKPEDSGTVKFSFKEAEENITRELFIPVLGQYPAACCDSF